MCFRPINSLMKIVRKTLHDTAVTVVVHDTIVGHVSRFIHRMCKYTYRQYRTILYRIARPLAWCAQAHIQITAESSGTISKGKYIYIYINACNPRLPPDNSSSGTASITHHVEKKKRQERGVGPGPQKSCKHAAQEGKERPTTLGPLDKTRASDMIWYDMMILHKPREQDSSNFRKLQDIQVQYLLLLYTIQLLQCIDE